MVVVHTTPCWLSFLLSDNWTDVVVQQRQLYFTQRGDARFSWRGGSCEWQSIEQFRTERVGILIHFPYGRLSNFSNVIVVHVDRVDGTSHAL